MISIRKRFGQIANAVEHGGVLRLFSILWERATKGYSQRSLTYSWPKPFNFEVVERAEACSWFFLPHLLSEHSFAGLQTLLEIAKQKLEEGTVLKIVLTDFGGSLESFYNAIAADSALIEQWSERIELIDSSNESSINLQYSKGDAFYVSAWWTMSALQNSLPSELLQRVTYIVQDDESLFYDQSDVVESNLYRLSQATYIPSVRYTVNSSSLAEHLTLKYGVNSKNAVAWEVFEPMIDRNKFFVDESVKKQKQVFVYARPNVSRNCFSLCVNTLKLAIESIPNDWQFVAAGTLNSDLDLGNGRKLKSLGKLTMGEYAKLLQRSAVGLSLMASPHPSHPPLELEACGAFVVTNRFSTKDLSKGSNRIISSELNAVDLSASLVEAVEKAQHEWSYLSE